MSAPAPADRAPDVEVRDLRFAWGEEGFTLLVPAFEVAHAQQVALTGPSGSGKTTLLNLLAGILVPDSGLVRVAGVEVTACSDAGRRALRRDRIGLVFQELELLEHLSVQENILLPYLLNRSLALTPEVRARLRQLAAELEIDGLLDRRPRALSQGERQRAAVCRALLPDPALLLVDEPTGNLDPARARVVMELLSAQARAREASMIVVTHDRALLDAVDAVHDLPALLTRGAA